MSTGPEGVFPATADAIKPLADVLGTGEDTEAVRRVVIYAGDYLNRLSGESLERECRRRLNEGVEEITVNFSRTEVVNSIGISILTGVIDAASRAGARVIFSDVNEHTAELFEMLGLSRHVELQCKND